MKTLLAPIGSAIIGILIAIGACVACSYFCLGPKADPHPVKYKVLPELPNEHSVLVKTDGSYTSND